MVGRLIKIIPEKYRFLSFLVITSLIGVSLILIAVYNASKELEMMHEIENLHRFTSAQLNRLRPDATNHQRMQALAAPDYQILIVDDEKILANSQKTTSTGWNIGLAELNESRQNNYGGYIELNGQMLTWAQMPLGSNNAQLLILHRFSSSGIATLKQVYLKRLLVPALFYIWLMVWMAFIVHFLTDKLLRQKQKMEQMALHDSLTGLPNRNLLTDRLEKMLGAAKRNEGHFALAMIDLDGFKHVNDTHGHAIGDAVLKKITHRMNACLRPQDTVARVGGDEFILLLDDIKRVSCLEICERVALEIAKPILIEDTEVKVGSSIGIAHYPAHAEDSETLNRKADQVMYEVKSQGGGIALYGHDVMKPEPRTVL